MYCVNSKKNNTASGKIKNNKWEWEKVIWKKCDICSMHHSNRKIPQEYWNREWEMTDIMRYKVGVILLRSDHSVLITESYNNCYGFPKGEKESCETIEECAKREFKEETGSCIDHVNLKDCEQVHTSIENIQYIFYIVRVSNFFQIKDFPTDDIEITSIGWIDINELTKYKLSKAVRKIYNIYMNTKFKKKDKHYYYKSKSLYDNFKKKRSNFTYYNSHFNKY